MNEAENVFLTLVQVVCGGSRSHVCLIFLHFSCSRSTLPDPHPHTLLVLIHDLKFLHVVFYVRLLLGPELCVPPVRSVV